MKKLIAIAMLSLSMVACSNNQHLQHHQLPKSGGATLHATQNSRLRDLMTDMNGLLFERIHTELDADLGRTKALKGISEDATKMSKNVDAIIETLPRLQLTTEQQTTFLALASELKTRALQLATLADNHQYQELSPALDELEQTCMACHHLFRAARL